MTEPERKTAREVLLDLLGQGEARGMLLAVVEKAMGGDLKSVEFILNLLGEKPGAEPEAKTLRVEFGPGVKELAQ